MSRGRSVLLIGLFLAAGCASTRPFAYQPGAPLADAPRLPFKVAVLPFQDGTENFTKRGSAFQSESLTYNLARSAVTPTLWAKAFADDLAASGRFREVRFVFDASELLDEEYAVDGTVLRAYASGGWETPSQYALEFRAVRRKDGHAVWARTVTRSPKRDRSAYAGCGASVSCKSDLAHAGLNSVMRELFAEAEADLARAVAGRAAGDGGRSGDPSPGGDAARPLEQEPVERTIERIMGER